MIKQHGNNKCHFNRASQVIRRGGLKALAEWEREAVHYFLEGYGKAAKGLASVPADAESFKATLDLFLIEKALYELRYEIANRPNWVEIPLRGLLEIVKE